MIKKNQKILNFINVFLDALLLFLAYPLAVYVRFNILNGQWGLDLLAPEYYIIAAAYSVLSVFIYTVLKLYTSHRVNRIYNKLILVTFVNAVSMLCLGTFLYTTRLMDFSRMVLLLYWLIGSMGVAIKHLVVSLILRYYRKLGYNQKHVLVVGNGKLAHQYIMDIKANPDMGYKVDGYVSAVKREELGKCWGSYEQLGEILSKHYFDELVVSLEPHETKYMKDVLEAADKEGTRISIIPFYNEYIPARPAIEVIGNTKLINMRTTPLDNFGAAFVKRAMDIVGALLLIILTSPVMLVVAIGVKLSSPGPILFKQERVGKNKVPFRMLKFRSMRVTGTENTGWSKDVDPRKTAFGSFIRKCSLDELPQFFNVLKGDMSLIGPRPEVPFHVNHFKEEIPLYLVRQQVRPGITGWAQVNGLRGDTSIEERVKYDIWYIENWSVALDIKILFKTVFGGMINSEKMVMSDK